VDLTAIRQGLADAAADAVTTPALNTYGYVPDAIVEPCFFPADVDIDFLGAMSRGMDTITDTCRVLASRADDKAGQALLDSYLKGSGTTSIKEALEESPTLGGACDDLVVLRVQGYRLYEHHNVHYVGAEFVVKVVGSGS
jgi:hypothetical protein